MTEKRIGPLTEAAPDIGPMMWEEITGPDGIVRQMQWTSRVEGSNGEPSGGKQSRPIDSRSFLTKFQIQ